MSFLFLTSAGGQLCPTRDFERHVQSIDGNIGDVEYVCVVPSVGLSNVPVGGVTIGRVDLEDDLLGFQQCGDLFRKQRRGSPRSVLVGHGVPLDVLLVEDWQGAVFGNNGGPRVPGPVYVVADRFNGRFPILSVFLILSTYLHPDAAFRELTHENDKNVIVLFTAKSSKHDVGIRQAYYLRFSAKLSAVLAFVAPLEFLPVPYHQL